MWIQREFLIHFCTSCYCGLNCMAVPTNLKDQPPFKKLKLSLTANHFPQTWP